MEKQIPLAIPRLDGNELRYLQECIESSYVSSVGPFVKKFEESFSRYCNTKYGVATANGTVALHLALEAIGIDSCDEVVLPTFTMIACANSIAYTGAAINLVDSEPRTWNLDVRLLEKSITKRTKAIMPVHIYGHPVDMDPVLEVARKHDLYVIEDAAEAHGAQYKGRKVGGIGHIGCFSFYANKIITTGEGGMIVTNSKEIAENVASLRNLAFDKARRFRHKRIAYNYRLTNIQAAVGLAQFERIDQFILRRRRNAKIYNEILSSMKGITIPVEETWGFNVYWMYSILVRKRERLITGLRKKGIESRVMFNPIHKQKPFRRSGSFPVAENLASRGLNLPSGNDLSDEKVQYIGETVRTIINDQ